MVLASSAYRKQPNIVPISAQPTELTLALDSGYSLAQLRGSMVNVSEPSYFLSEGLSSLPDKPEEGVFTYLSGDAEDLVGKTFAVGNVAHSFDPGRCQKNADSVDNKIKSSLVMALGLLTYQAGLPVHLSINLLPCIQKVTEQSNKLIKARLQGTHTIGYGRRRLKVTVNVLGCADEGLGVLAVTPGANISSNTVVISIGGGTINVSQFSKGRLITQEPFGSGVMALYDQLALSDGVVKHLSAQGDPHIIRLGVERGDFHYGGPASPGRFSFYEDYESCLPQWFEATFARPLQVAKRLMLKADQGLVFGGGAKLPLIKPLLEQFNFKIVEDPVNANVHGLYKIAQSIVQKR